MSKQYINLKKGWNVKPTSTGLELTFLDKNVNLDLSKLTKTDKLTISMIFNGQKSISGLSNKKIIYGILLKLKKDKILKFSKLKPGVKRTNKVKSIVEKLRQKLLSPKGPILRVYKLNPDASVFFPINKHIYSAKYISKTRNSHELYEVWSSGTDNQDSISEFKAIMEAIERYYSGEIDISKSIWTTMDKLKQEAINPNTLISYESNLYERNNTLKPFNPKKKYYWKEGKLTLTNQRVYLPIDLIYYPIKKEVSPHLITFSNSSGIASGLDHDNTLKRSLYEIIERDAFMIIWLNRLRMPRIDIKSLPHQFQSRIFAINKLHVEVYLVNLTLDTIPVILAIATGTQKNPFLGIGAGACTSAVLAIDKALSELELGLYWNFRKDSHKTKICDPKKVQRISDHVNLYRNIRFIKQASFLWKGKEMPIENDITLPNNLNYLLKKIKRSGHEVLEFDISPKCLKMLNISILRGFIPGFVPISFGYFLEPLTMKRIWKLPQTLNLSVSPWPKNIPLPHPFP